MKRVALSFLLVVASLIGSGTVGHAGQYDFGAAAFNKGDYATALTLLRPLAEEGNANAEIYLGRMYAEGRGVAQDDLESAQWYRRAADLGQPYAELALGEMYYSRQPPDYQEAAKWYHHSAEHGLALSQFALAAMYEKGQGVTQDYNEAVKWYGAAIKSAPATDSYLKGQAITARNRVLARIASPNNSNAEVGTGRTEGKVTPNFALGAVDQIPEDSRGARSGLLEDGVAAYAKGDYATAVRLWRRLAYRRNIDAAYNLGWMYENGKGVPQDYRQAAAWYQIAAMRGDATAQANLGMMYKSGLGVPRDLLQSYVWFSISSVNSIGKLQTDSTQQRDAIASDLVPADLVRAEQMAGKCQGSNFQECD